MRMTRFGLLLLGAVAAVATACSDDNDSNGPSSTANVRVIHAIPDGPATVDVLVDNKTVVTALEYGHASDYHKVATGVRAISVNESGTANVVLSTSPDFQKDSSYTVIATGMAAAPQSIVLHDDAAGPAAGNAKLRLVHGAPGAGAVDIYITTPGADLSALTPDFSNVTLSSGTPYTEVVAGDYQIRFTATGTKTVALDTGTLTLADGDVSTAIALDDAGGGAPFSAVVFDDNQ